jgi:hypothetical protein
MPPTKASRAATTASAICSALAGDQINVVSTCLCRPSPEPAVTRRRARPRYGLTLQPRGKPRAFIRMDRRPLTGSAGRAWAGRAICEQGVSRSVSSLPARPGATRHDVASLGALQTSDSNGFR